ncbi:hypothetical protein DEO72_LG3g689 [Vigna unguiculata]|uniref:Uncharacterized protein n=1 Tax=Vigna unguiculata TaxID=3917 RepID=A0A4D6LC85_VIGUN|nr:hypothetical protein DEO72_LG3g689 [Vigna unguiculata]
MGLYIKLTRNFVQGMWLETLTEASASRHCIWRRYLNFSSCVRFVQKHFVFLFSSSSTLHWVFFLLLRSNNLFCCSYQRLQKPFSSSYQRLQKPFSSSYQHVIGVVDNVEEKPSSKNVVFDLKDLSYWRESRETPYPAIILTQAKIKAASGFIVFRDVCYID